MLVAWAFALTSTSKVAPKKIKKGKSIRGLVCLTAGDRGGPQQTVRAAVVPDQQRCAPATAAAGLQRAHPALCPHPALCEQRPDAGLASAARTARVRHSAGVEDWGAPHEAWQQVVAALVCVDKVIVPRPGFRTPKWDLITVLVPCLSVPSNRTTSEGCVSVFSVISNNDRDDCVMVLTPEHYPVGRLQSKLAVYSLLLIDSSGWRAALKASRN